MSYGRTVFTDQIDRRMLLWVYSKLVDGVRPEEVLPSGNLIWRQAVETRQFEGKTYASLQTRWNRKLAPLFKSPDGLQRLGLLIPKRQAERILRDLFPVQYHKLRKEKEKATPPKKKGTDEEEEEEEDKENPFAFPNIEEVEEEASSPVASPSRAPWRPQPVSPVSSTSAPTVTAVTASPPPKRPHRESARLKQSRSCPSPARPAAVETKVSGGGERSPTADKRGTVERSPGGVDGRERSPTPAFGGVDRSTDSSDSYQTAHTQLSDDSPAFAFDETEYEAFLYAGLHRSKPA